MMAVSAEIEAEDTPPTPADDDCIARLQEHVKQTIAPYKYPRSVLFTDSIPKTATGKLQRFRLRNPD